MRKKKWSRTSEMGFAWYVRHVIDVIYHWILKNVLRKYPITCQCFPDSKFGFNWPTKKVPYYKTKANQIAMVEIDSEDIYMTIDSEKENIEIAEQRKELWREQLLKAANGEFSKK